MPYGRGIRARRPTYQYPQVDGFGVPHTGDPRGNVRFTQTKAPAAQVKPQPAFKPEDYAGVEPPMMPELTQWDRRRQIDNAVASLMQFSAEIGQNPMAWQNAQNIKNRVRAEEFQESQAAWLAKVGAHALTRQEQEREAKARLMAVQNFPGALKSMPDLEADQLANYLLHGGTLPEATPPPSPIDLYTQQQSIATDEAVRRQQALIEQKATPENLARIAKVTAAQTQKKQGEKGVKGNKRSPRPLADQLLWQLVERELKGKQVPYEITDPAAREQWRAAERGRLFGVLRPTAMAQMPQFAKSKTEDWLRPGVITGTDEATVLQEFLPLLSVIPDEEKQPYILQARDAMRKAGFKAALAELEAMAAAHMAKYGQ